MSDRKTDEATSAAVKGAGALAVAAKAAVEQNTQIAAKTTETAVGAAASAMREAAAIPASMPTATLTQGAAEATQAQAERATSTLKTTMEKAMTTAEEMLSFGQGNIEAFMKSGQIWTTGMQDLSRHMAQSAQAQIDGTMGVFKALASVKSVHEAIELQSTIARTAFEKVVLDGGKLTDASLKLAEQTIAPLTARLNYVAERFGRVSA